MRKAESTCMDQLNFVGRDRERSSVGILCITFGLLLGASSASGRVNGDDPPYASRQDRTVSKHQVVGDMYSGLYIRHDPRAFLRKSTSIIPIKNSVAIHLPI